MMCGVEFAVEALFKPVRDWCTWRAKAQVRRCSKGRATISAEVSLS